MTSIIFSDLLIIICLMGMAIPFILLEGVEKSILIDKTSK